MIRRLNYTNRKKINREHVVITATDDGDSKFFNADLSRLGGYDFPIDSLVFLEAYRLSNWMRFPFGSVGNLIPPKSTALDSFDSLEGIKFRVKVTSAKKNHMLLAEANAIPLLIQDQERSARDPLLPVMPSSELGDEIYRVDYSEGSPVLLINSDVGYYKNIGLSPAFVSLVLPSVFREILTKIVIVEKSVDDNDMDDWRCRWIRFSTQLLGSNELPTLEDPDESEDWIQRTVSVFSAKQKLKSQFKSFWREEL